MDLGKLIVDKLLHEFMEDDDDVVEVRVGRVSKQLLEEFEANRTAHEAEHKAIKEKIDAYIDEVTASHSCSKYNDEKAEIWEKVYDELGLSEYERGFGYTIKNGSRIVFRKEQQAGEEKEQVLQN